jgi:ATPase subunit of ABC transporter with duplicated ATPase domains
VERLQTSELARSNIQRPFIKFDMKRPSGKHILEFDDLNWSYGEKQVIQNFTARVLRGERIALMGRNGTGKTSLIKALLNSAPGMSLEKDGTASGKVLWGHEAQIGYFSQDHRESIEKGKTVFEWLNQFDPEATKEELRGLLGRMLFAQEEGMKPTAALSGGEAARLIFCRLMLQQPNFLVLDEPTNHLDLEAINALNVALQRYEGTVLLVTHDHDLIDEVATRLWRFDHETIEDFQGTYSELNMAKA